MTKDVTYNGDSNPFFSLPTTFIHVMESTFLHLSLVGIQYVDINLRIIRKLKETIL